MDPLVIARSVRRSALRARILLTLAHRRRAYAQLLAEALDVPARDVRRAMHGHLPAYSPKLSPIRLQLVTRRTAGGRSWYEITAKGRAVARDVRRLRGRR